MSTLPTEVTGAQGALEAAEAADQLIVMTASYTVTTPADYTRAGEDLKRIKGALKRLEDVRTSITGPLNASLKKVNEFFGGPSAELTASERRIKQAMGAYSDRARAAQEAETARRLALQRAEEAERRAAAEVAAAELAEAAELAAVRGDEEQAARLSEVAQAQAEAAEAPPAPPPVLVPRRHSPAVPGISELETWHCEVTDIPALVRAVAAGEAPTRAVVPDLRYLKAVVKAAKGGVKIPGVRVWRETDIRSGRV
jgi:hypothetical protein